MVDGSYQLLWACQRFEQRAPERTRIVSSIFGNIHYRYVIIFMEMLTFGGDQEMTYDFRHEAMHVIAKWPILEQIVRSRRSKARRLDSRMVAALYAESSGDWWCKMSDAEHDFAMAAIDAHQINRSPLAARTELSNDPSR